MMEGKKNAEGYQDPTAYGAMKAVEKQEIQEREMEIGKLMKHIKYMADLNGFELKNRIVFRDKRTGKEYK